MIRSAQPEDTNFILDTWLRSYGDTMTPPEIDEGYPLFHRELIPGLIARSDVRVMLDEHGDGIVGWACVERLGEWNRKTQLVHYVYVKWDWRRGKKGPHVARELLDEMLDPNVPVYVTHCRRPQHVARILREGWSLAPNMPFYRLVGSLLKGESDADRDRDGRSSPQNDGRPVGNEKHAP